MKIVDANLLLYAVNADDPRHRRARAWLEEVLSGSETVAFDWTVLLAFLRLSTHPSVFPAPLRAGEALDLVESWLAQPCVLVLAPGAGHSRALRELLPPGRGGTLVMDAHLAALAREHQAELCSSDAGFGRFPGLRWTDPLR